MAAREATHVVLEYMFEEKTYRTNVAPELASYINSDEISDLEQHQILKQLVPKSIEVQVGELHVRTKPVAKPVVESNRPRPTCNDSRGSTASSSTGSQFDKSKDQHSGSTHFWTESEVKCLLSLRLPMETLFVKGEKNHNILWQQVQGEMKKLGFSSSLTVNQIVNKWNSLKKRYKKVKDNSSKTGSAKMNFQYLDEFENIFCDRASTIPSYTSDTLTVKHNDSSSSSTCTSASTSNDSIDNCYLSISDDDITPVKKRKTDSSNTCNKPIESSRANRGLRNTQLELMTEMKDLSKKMASETKLMHDDKMVRMDRFLDLFEKSLKK